MSTLDWLSDHCNYITDAGGIWHTSCSLHTAWGQRSAAEQMVEIWGLTHRLFVLEQMDQAVQHRSQVPEGGRGRSRSRRRAHRGKWNRRSQEPNRCSTKSKDPQARPPADLLWLDVVEVLAQTKVSDGSVLGQPHQQGGQVRVQAWGEKTAASRKGQILQVAAQTWIPSKN